MRSSNGTSSSTGARCPTTRPSTTAPQRAALTQASTSAALMWTPKLPPQQSPAQQLPSRTTYAITGRGKCLTIGRLPCVTSASPGTFKAGTSLQRVYVRQLVHPPVRVLSPLLNDGQQGGCQVISDRVDAVVVLLVLLRWCHGKTAGFRRPNLEKSSLRKE